MAEITSSSERFLLRAAPVSAGALPAETINSLPPTAIQDGQTELLTIGNLSKQTGVHVKSLRYYEQLGILLPAYTDPDTGYRYYTLSQIPVVNAIRACIFPGYSPEGIYRLPDQGPAKDPL